MYSVVLLAALTTGGANAPACHNSCCYSCAGCYGGCYGCWGGYGGCYGCYGYSGGCYGCYGGCYGCYGGCYGCYGSSYAPVYSAPMQMIPSAIGTPVGPMPGPADVKKKDEARLAPTRAKVIVELPAEAKLYIDDQLMKTTSERRTFQTPALDKGQAYYYEVRAELVLNGKTVTETRRVIVRAGEEARASFNEMTVAGSGRALAGK